LAERETIPSALNRAAYKMRLSSCIKRVYITSYRDGPECKDRLDVKQRVRNISPFVERMSLLATQI
jgi:hypothetical protein